LRNLLAYPRRYTPSRLEVSRARQNEYVIIWKTSKPISPVGVLTHGGLYNQPCKGSSVCLDPYDSSNGTKIGLQVSIPLPGNVIPASSCQPVDPNHPPSPAPAAPTGILWNPSSAFLVPGTKLPAAFIFATEDGTVSAWAGGLNPADNAVLAVDNSASPSAADGAVYKGLVFGLSSKGAFLLSTPRFLPAMRRLAFRTSTAICLSPMRSKTLRGTTTSRDLEGVSSMYSIRTAICCVVLRAAGRSMRRGRSPVRHLRSVGLAARS